MTLQICGIDEVGRGCLAGPVVSAAVIIDKKKIPLGAKDSKQLSEKKRNELYAIILSNAAFYSIGVASNIEIDKINILNAAMLSMERAFQGLTVKPDVAIIDGPIAPKNLINIESLRVIRVIKADEKIKLVSCASIIAKVFRDRLMISLDNKYPEYGFRNHKGYATKEHKSNLRKYGFSEIHRRTFKY